MKKTLIALTLTLLLCRQSQLFAQEYGTHRIYVKKSAAFPDNDGDRLHKIANVFAKEVGDLLKEYTPMEIDTNTLSIKIECYHDSVKLTYYVELVNCPTENAMYHFDHRGALTKDTRHYSAVEDAENRCADQAVVVKGKFEAAYGSKYFQRYLDVTTKCNGFTYALSEYFIASKK